MTERRLPWRVRYLAEAIEPSPGPVGDMERAVYGSGVVQGYSRLLTRVSLLLFKVVFAAFLCGLLFGAIFLINAVLTQHG